MKGTIIFISLAMISLIAASQNQNVVFNTELGKIVAELYPDKAPATCDNFVKYIKNGKFEGAHFYRVVRLNNQSSSKVKIEVIQGGLGFDVEESPYPCIRHETTEETGLLHENGTLSMARAEPGTASSEFFICIGDQPELDFGGKRNTDGQGFAAFGKVVLGMDIVKQILNMPDNAQMLISPVSILSVEIKEKEQ